MNDVYIPRSLEAVLTRAASQFPSITLTGPRQSGKTTLLKRVFGATHRYVSVDIPNVRAQAESDPHEFFRRFPPPVIIDEAQYAPILFPYVKEIIDNRRSEKGLFILSGSQNFNLLAQITESLTGRTAVLRLFPLTHQELSRRESTDLPWERNESPAATAISAAIPIWQEIWKGFYPEPALMPDTGWDQWQGTRNLLYLERDVRSLRQIGDLNQFQAFMEVLAARSAQLLNLNDISSDLGIAANTLKSWLSVLEASFTVIILRPYFKNVGKRLVKMPKVYFTDSGMLSYLTGYKTPELVAAGPMAGPIFETAVVMEIYKRFTNRGEIPRMYFWRTSTGNEVDLVIEQGQRLIPVEIKRNSTPWPSMGDSIRAFIKDYPEQVTEGYVVYPGDQKAGLGHGVQAYPFADL